MDSNLPESSGVVLKKVPHVPDGIDPRQKEILFKYFKAHPYLMLGKCTESFSKEDKAVLWFQVAQKLNNAIPDSTQRSWKQWEHIWGGFSEELPQKVILTELEFSLLQLLRRAKTLPFEELFWSNASESFLIKDLETEPKLGEHKETVEIPREIHKAVQDEDETELNNTTEDISHKENTQKEDEIEDVKRQTSDEPSIVTQGYITENEFSEDDSRDTEINIGDRKPKVEEEMEILTISNGDIPEIHSTKFLVLDSSPDPRQTQEMNEPSAINRKGRLSNIEKVLIKKFIKSDLMKMKYLKRKLKMENEYHKRKLTLMKDLLLLKKRKVNVEERQATALLRISRSLHRLMQNPRLRPEQQ